ncbi:MAG: hypothetical protein J5J06_14580 [Phycisphaerae bacterium]|nr:hypothetical protein [Phycisphaerae bacterium]
MLSTESTSFDTWSPDFSSSGQQNPTWTRAVTCGQVLCNSMERVEWAGGNPVQVLLCEQCGCAGCNSHGYVQITRLSDSIIWTRPVFDSDIGGAYRCLDALGGNGAIHVPETIWTEWQQRFDSLPDLSVFPRTTRSELIDAWLLEMPPCYRAAEGVSAGDLTVSPLARARLLIPNARDRLLACTSMDVPAAQRLLDRILKWAESGPAAPIDGAIRRRDVEMEALYLDGHGTEDWHAFAIAGGNVYLAFGADWVLDPPVTDH